MTQLLSHSYTLPNVFFNLIIKTNHLVSEVDCVIISSTAAEPLVKSVRLHGNAVMCLAADDKYIISGSKDCTVAVYDRRAGKGLKRLRVDANTQTHMWFL